MPEDERQQQVAGLGAVGAFGFEELLGAAEPAAGAAHLTALCEVHSQPECAPQRRASFTGCEARLIGAIEKREVLLRQPEHEGRRREPLEFGGRQCCRPIRRHELLVLRGPRDRLSRVHAGDYR